MPIVHECAAPDCHVLTMGAYCLEHEDVEKIDLQRESLVGTHAPAEPPSAEAPA